MAILSWSTSYSIGVAVLDSEHKQLFDLLNQLYDGLIDGSASNANTGAILAQVLDFSVKHCDHEEEMLAEVYYPGLPELTHQHQMLRRQIEEFQRKLTGANGVSFEIARFLMDWILEHIVKEDKKCGAFLNAAGIR